MLVFTRLLIIFSVFLLIFGIVLYSAGYYISQNASLKYYPTVQPGNPTLASYYFVQNGTTSIKYMGLFMWVLCALGLASAFINERLRLSEHLHHLRKRKPLH
jgi:hypothetical protein